MAPENTQDPDSAELAEYLLVRDAGDLLGHFVHTPCGEVLATPINLLMAMIIVRVHRNTCPARVTHGE